MKTRFAVEVLKTLIEKQIWDSAVDNTHLYPGEAGKRHAWRIVNAKEQTADNEINRQRNQASAPASSATDRFPKPDDPATSKEITSPPIRPSVIPVSCLL